MDTVFTLWKNLSPVPWYYSPFPRQYTKCDFPAFINEVRELKYLRHYVISAEMCDLRSTAMNWANDIYMQIIIRYTFEVKGRCIREA